MKRDCAKELAADFVQRCGGQGRPQKKSQGSAQHCLWTDKKRRLGFNMGGQCLLDWWERPAPSGGQLPGTERTFSEL